MAIGATPGGGLARGLVVTGCLTFMLCLSAQQPGYVDDAFITLRYVDHWLETGVLTWHRDLPAVDGFSSLGHVLLIAMLGATGVDLVAASSALSAAAFALIVWLLFRECRVQGLSTSHQQLALALLCVNAGIAFWFFAGLETMLMSAAVFAAYCSAEHVMRRRRLCLTLVASLLACIVIRPEGVLVAIGVYVYVAVYLRRHGATLGPLVAVGAFVLLAALAPHLWRLWAYGHPFPNTYYAKRAASWTSETSDGLRYLALFVTFHGGFVVVGSLLSLRRALFGNTRLLFILGIMGLAVASGGDPFPHARFLVPAWPLLVLDMVALVAAAGSVRRIAGGVLVGLYAMAQMSVAAVFPFNDLPLAERIAWASPWTRAARGASALVAGRLPVHVEQQGQHPLARAYKLLGRIVRPDTQVAATDVGTLAFYSKLPVLDLGGLNSKRIAHQPKAEGAVNHWGHLRPEHALLEQAELLVVGFPAMRQEAAAMLDLRALPRERVQALFGYAPAIDWRFLEAGYTCVSVPMFGNYLNIFALRHAVETIWRARPPGVLIRECLYRGIAAELPVVVSVAPDERWAFDVVESRLRVASHRLAGGWAWHDLGGFVMSTPAPVVHRDGRMEVYVRGVDSSLWRIRRPGTAGAAWSDWELLPGALEAAPAAVAGVDGGTLLFAWGLDGALWHAATDGEGGLGPWVSAGGSLGSAPTAVGHTDGSIEVVAYSDGGLKSVLRQPDGAWSPWRPLRSSTPQEHGLPTHCETDVPCPTPQVVLRDDGVLELDLRTIDGERFTGTVLGLAAQAKNVN